MTPHPVQRIRAGAQLYTVRKHMKTLADATETFRRIRAIGYELVQLSGLGPEVDRAQAAEALRAAGLRAAVLRVAWPRLRDQVDEVVAEQRLFDCRHAALGSLPRAYRDAAGLECFLREMEPVLARFAAEDLYFTYHNHQHEFARINGETWLAGLLRGTEARAVGLELDTYWVQAGGGDPAAWIRACRGRLPNLHVKDMVIGADGQQRFTPVGDGNLNWHAVFEASGDAGVETLLVEQDECYEDDPFDCLARSFAFLKAHGYS